MVKIKIRINENALQVIKDAKEQDLVIVRVGASDISPIKEMIEQTAELISKGTPDLKCGLIVIPYYIKVHNLKFERNI